MVSSGADTTLANKVSFRAEAVRNNSHGGILSRSQRRTQRQNHWCEMKRNRSSRRDETSDPRVFERAPSQVSPACNRVASRGHSPFGLLRRQKSSCVETKPDEPALTAISRSTSSLLPKLPVKEPIPSRVPRPLQLKQPRMAGALPSWLLGQFNSTDNERKFNVSSTTFSDIGTAAIQRAVASKRGTILQLHFEPPVPTVEAAEPSRRGHSLNHFLLPTFSRFKASVTDRDICTAVAPVDHLVNAIRALNTTQKTTQTPGFPRLFRRLSTGVLAKEASAAPLMQQENGIEKKPEARLSKKSRSFHTKDWNLVRSAWKSESPAPLPEEPPSWRQLLMQTINQAGSAHSQRKAVDVPDNNVPDEDESHRLSNRNRSKARDRKAVLPVSATRGVSPSLVPSKPAPTMTPFWWIEIVVWLFKVVPMWYLTSSVTRHISCQIHRKILRISRISSRSLQVRAAVRPRSRHRSPSPLLLKGPLILPRHEIVSTPTVASNSNYATPAVHSNLSSTNNDLSASAIHEGDNRTFEPAHPLWEISEAFRFVVDNVTATATPPRHREVRHHRTKAPLSLRIKSSSSLQQSRRALLRKERRVQRRRRKERRRQARAAERLPSTESPLLRIAASPRSAVSSFLTNVRCLVTQLGGTMPGPAEDAYNFHEMRLASNDDDRRQGATSWDFTMLLPRKPGFPSPSARGGSAMKKFGDRGGKMTLSSAEVQRPFPPVVTVAASSAGSNSMNSSTAPENELDVQQWTETESPPIFFSMIPPSSPENNNTDATRAIRMVAYAPDLFRQMRQQAFGISDLEFRESLLSTGPYVSYSSNSKGAARTGGYFFLSRDGRYLIKRIKSDEANLLLKSFLPKYCRYMKSQACVGALQHPGIRGNVNPRTGIRSRSLLNQIYGLYEIRIPKVSSSHNKSPTRGADKVGYESSAELDNDSVYESHMIVVMNSIFPAEAADIITERYDLKGSTRGRECSLKEQISKRDGAVLKDENILVEMQVTKAVLKETADKRKQQEFLKMQFDSASEFMDSQVGKKRFKPRKRRNRFVVLDKKAALPSPTAETLGLHIGAGAKQALMSQLAEDVRLLSECGVIDYSLLVGVARSNGELQHGKPILCSTGAADVSVLRGYRLGRPVQYYIGVIDFFQPFNWKKEGEYRWKTLVHGGRDDFSCIPPLLYAQRFLRFLDQVIT
jgi:Phosphatidylinositol-4-phosphate 5-Kinase